MHLADYILTISFDTLVFLITFIKTFRLARQAKRAHIKNSLTYLLLRDGEFSYASSPAALNDELWLQARYTTCEPNILTANTFPDCRLSPVMLLSIFQIIVELVCYASLAFVLSVSNYTQISWIPSLVSNNPGFIFCEK